MSTTTRLFNDSGRLFQKSHHADYAWAAAMAGKIITIEGTIGVGKTTLGRSMVRWLQNIGVECTIFLEEAFDAALLTKFIEFNMAHPKDHNPHAARFQMDMLRRRQDTYATAEAYAARGYFVVVDRSLFGDTAFALLQKDDGNMDARQWADYESLMHEVELHEPTFTLYLDCAPELAFERMRRRGRESEKDYTLKYFRDLASAYAHVLKQVSHTVHVVDWGAERPITATGDLPNAIIRKMLVGFYRATYPVDVDDV